MSVNVHLHVYGHALCTTCTTCITCMWSCTVDVHLHVDGHVMHTKDEIIYVLHIFSLTLCFTRTIKL